MGTWVYLFPRKAVTKCHKATVFKKQNLYSLTDLEGRIPRSWCQQGRFHSEVFSLVLSAAGLVCFPMTSSLRAHWVKRESD